MHLHRSHRRLRLRLLVTSVVKEPAEAKAPGASRRRPRRRHRARSRRRPRRRHRARSAGPAGLSHPAGPAAGRRPPPATGSRSCAQSRRPCSVERTEPGQRQSRSCVCSFAVASGLVSTSIRLISTGSVVQRLREFRVRRPGQWSAAADTHVSAAFMPTPNREGISRRCSGSAGSWDLRTLLLGIEKGSRHVRTPY